MLRKLTWGLMFLVIFGVSSYLLLASFGELAPAVREVTVYTPPYPWRPVVNVKPEVFDSLCHSGEISVTFTESHPDSVVLIEYFGLSADRGKLYRTNIRPGDYYDFQAEVQEEKNPIIVRWVRPSSHERKIIAVLGGLIASFCLTLYLLLVVKTGKGKPT